MPINVFGNSPFSHDNGNNIDTSLFVHKPFLRTKYIESDIEENIDLKNQFRIKNLPFPVKNTDAVCKSYVDSGLNHPSIIRNTAHVDFNDENLDNVRFVKVNSRPAVSQHLAPKHYVDDAIDEISLVRNNQDNNFNIFNFTNINSITLNTQTVNDKQVITKSYVDQFRQENERARRDLRIDFYNESSDLVKNTKTTILTFIN